MKKFISMFWICIFTLLACSTQISSPTTAPSPAPTLNTPIASPSEIAPTTTPNTMTMTELGISDPNMAKVLAGIEKTITHEADGSYSVQATSYAENATKDGFDQKSEKYTIDKTTFNIHADTNNAYAPATVDAKDASGKQITLIWNETLGWVEKFNASTDIESPTDFPYEARIPILQSILLDHADPFSKRSNGLLVHSENTDNGRVVYLRTDNASGSNSKRTDYWLRVKMPNGSNYYINPVDINDINDRKIMMCAYPKEYTNPNGAQNPKLDQGFRAMFIKYLKTVDSVNGPVWGIIQADSSFLDKFTLQSAPMPGSDGSDLNYLLTLFNPKTTLPNMLLDRTHFSNPEDKNPIIESSIYTLKPDGSYALGSVDNSIQELIIPCATQ